MLGDSSNVLVHLEPAPVVARVATTTALIRPHPAAFLAREVAVTEWLAGRGAPVVPPSGELPPGPHSHDGFAITFWRLVRPRPGAVPDVGEVARLLADLHLALRAYPGELPHLTPALEEVGRGLDFLATTGQFEPADLDAIRAAHARLEPELADSSHSVQALHGDAHPGNVIVTGDAILWSDFEDTCRGPVAWDLACLMRASAWSDDAALGRYPDAPSPEQLKPFLDARALQGTMWLAVMAQRFPELGDRAAARVRAWRGGA